jgi:hypothetical protein
MRNDAKIKFAVYADPGPTDLTLTAVAHFRIRPMPKVGKQHDHLLEIAHGIIGPGYNKRV